MLKSLYSPREQNVLPNNNPSSFSFYTFKWGLDLLHRGCLIKVLALVFGLSNNITGIYLSIIINIKQH